MPRLGETPVYIFGGAGIVFDKQDTHCATLDQDERRVNEGDGGLGARFPPGLLLQGQRFQACPGFDVKEVGSALVDAQLYRFTWLEGVAVAKDTHDILLSPAGSDLGFCAGWFDHDDFGRIASSPPRTTFSGRTP